MGGLGREQQGVGSRIRVDAAGAGSTRCVGELPFRIKISPYGDEYLLLAYFTLRYTV